MADFITQLIAAFLMGIGLAFFLAVLYNISF